LKIALIGHWQMIRLAHWVVGELQLMTKVLFQYWKDFKSMKEINLSYVKGADVSVGRTQFCITKINMTDKSGFPEAIAAAKQADVVIMVLGEHGLQSGEGRSRSDLGLPGVQQELLETIFKANPNVVLVLNNGRPLAIPWADENIPAIVEGWHLGTQSGNAIAQVLYGDYNPSGKLPMTSKECGQVPIYYNYKNTDGRL
jgi:beta-glucosidase